MVENQSDTAGSAIVLICDQNYFVPTFSAALSADRHTATEVPVYVFVVNSEPSWPEQFGKAVANTNIRIVAAHLPQLEEAAQFHRDRYLPPIALARLWIEGLIDPQIDRFLYIDGDTMVDGGLDSLLSIRPPLGGIMAAPDAVQLFLDELSLGRKHDLAYLEGLGCDTHNYFNSGVIYASREAWKSIVPDALDFLLGHPELCRSSDQSALNHAARGHVAMLPLTYNYQSDHMMTLDPRNDGFSPIVWHFTGAPKPWDAAVWPWNGYFNRFYSMASLLLIDFDLRTPTPPEAQIRAGISHRRRTRNRLNLVYPWRRITRKEKILRLLSSGTF